MTDFNPKIKYCGSIHPVVARNVIVEETLLYSASLSFAASYGGPLTKAALGVLEKQGVLGMDVPPGFQWVIDTRTHMLMPGQFPAIPGWHCDGVPREGYESQPNVHKLNEDVYHAVVHVSTDEQGVSDTEFINSAVSVVVNSERVWKSVHGGVSAIKELGITRPGDGQVILFNMPTIHRATPAERRGWRWWMRASMYYNKPINQIRRHVQVYTVSEGGGW